MMRKESPESLLCEFSIYIHTGIRLLPLMRRCHSSFERGVKSFSGLHVPKQRQAYVMWSIVHAVRWPRCGPRGPSAFIGSELQRMKKKP